MTNADLTGVACSLCDEGEILTNAFIPRDMNGKTLRHILMNVDFGLQVSFCDRADLRDSLEHTLMPPLLLHLAALLNVPAYKLQSNFKDDDIEDLLNGDEDANDGDDDDGDLNDSRDLDTNEGIQPEDEEQYSHQHDCHRTQRH